MTPGTLVTPDEATVPTVLSLAISAAYPLRTAAHGAPARPAHCSFARRYLAPAAAVLGYGIGAGPVPRARDRYTTGEQGGGAPLTWEAFARSCPLALAADWRAGSKLFRSLRSAPAQVPARALAGAAAAARVLVAVPAVPAMAWAAATAAALGAAVVAAGAGPAVAPLIRAMPVPAVLAPVARDRRMLRRWALRAHGRALLASGDDSPPGAGYPASCHCSVAGNRAGRGAGRSSPPSRSAPASGRSAPSGPGRHVPAPGRPAWTRRPPP